MYGDTSSLKPDISILPGSPGEITPLTTSPTVAPDDDAAPTPDDEVAPTPDKVAPTSGDKVAPTPDDDNEVGPTPFAVSDSVKGM